MAAVDEKESEVETIENDVYGQETKEGKLNIFDENGIIYLFIEIHKVHLDSW